MNDERIQDILKVDNEFFLKGKKVKELGILSGEVLQV